MDRRLSLAIKYHDAGLGDEAWAVMGELLAEADASADALRFAVALRLKAGAPAEALELCGRLLAKAPTAGAWMLKGEALAALSRSDAAVAAFAQAVATAPDDPQAHLALSAAEAARGKLAAAEAAARAALALDTESSKAWTALGHVLTDSGRPAEAAHAFHCAITADPRAAAAHTGLGAVLAGLGQYAAAEAQYRAALAIAADDAPARINLGVALLEQGQGAAAEAEFAALLARDPSNRQAADNRLYAQIYAEADPRVVCAEHRRWGAAHASASQPEQTFAKPQSDTRLRVGYVSPDFRRHSVAFFVAPLLEAHDPAAVEVFCYSDVATPDAVTERLKRAVPHWRDVRGLSDAALRDQIIADRIDILVDLAGHTQNNRLAVFAMRAAPIQATMLGYPATTGLPAMDYRLCDWTTDPAGAEAFAVETLVRLAPALHCYAAPENAPDVTMLPALKNGFVTFSSFNKLAKITPATIALWAQVLAALPDARLVLKSKALAETATQDRLAAKFEAAGVARQRLAFSGWLAADGDHLATYGGIDIALDTIPYNGTTTTCEALWMGVPVLTLAGESHASRVSASLLSAVGLGDWVAESSADFVARAVRAAGDCAGLAALRSLLRARVAASALCGARSYARAVEAAFRRMYETRLS